MAESAPWDAAEGEAARGGGGAAGGGPAGRGPPPGGPATPATPRLDQFKVRVRKEPQPAAKRGPLVSKSFKL